MVEIHGVADSMNCLGPVLLATAAGCGCFLPCDQGEGAYALEFSAMNPFSDVPTLKDGSFSLGESNAILRYLAEKYTRTAYPEADPKRRAFIDWAMDFFKTGMYDDAVRTIYFCLGYAAPPEDLASAGKDCSERLAKFAEVFLREKFIGGDCLSIADYRVAPFFFAYGHPMLRERCLVEVPDRIKQFNRNFAQVCPSADLLVVRSGHGLKELMDIKYGGRAEMLMEGPVAPLAINTMLEERQTAGKGQVRIYGSLSSMNGAGPIMLASHAEIGSMVCSPPGEDICAPELLGLSSCHEVILQDGKFWMAEPDAILRYLAQTYAPQFYTQDCETRAFINWAMDRFNTGMLEDALQLVRVTLGLLPEPRSSADLEDLQAAGKAASENMADFCHVFLKEKFVGGNELSIADFKVAPFFAAYGHPVIRDRYCVDIPDRIKRFNEDFAIACPASRALWQADGSAILEMLDACDTNSDSLAPEEQHDQTVSRPPPSPPPPLPSPPRLRQAWTQTCGCFPFW